MGFLREQARRLLRTKFTSPQMLAEEIFAILSADVPVVFDSGVEIQQPPNGVPPLIIHTEFDDEGNPINPIQIVTNKTTAPDIPPNPDQEPYDPGGGPMPPSVGGGGAVGQIITKVSGATYTCNVWTNVPISSPPSLVIDVPMLNLSGLSTIPAGVYVGIQVLRETNPDNTFTTYYYGLPNTFIPPPP